MVNDGDPNNADDDAIAQAIYDSKCQGVVTLGAQSGTAINELGEEITQRFDRVAILAGHARVTVTTIDGVSAAGIKQAIQDSQPTVSGQDVIWSKLFGSITKVAGVEDTTELLIGIDAPTQEENIPVTDLQQVEFAGGDIEVIVS